MDEISEADLDEKQKQTTEEELEAARDRQDDLREQIERCRNLLERHRQRTSTTSPDSPLTGNAPSDT